MLNHAAKTLQPYYICSQIILPAMKNIFAYLLLASCALMLSCNQATDKASVKQAAQNTSAPTTTITTVAHQGNEDSVSCDEFAKKNPMGSDSILIQICFWRQYKLVRTGTPDYKGRYSYEYQVFRMVRGKAKTIKNSDIFNDKVAGLEQKLNALIAKSHQEDADQPDNQDCLAGFELPYFKIDQIGMSFNDKQEMNFDVTFNVGDACMNVGGATATLPLAELKEYLK
jgi:hypothetical protein